jgi:site-specific DNA-methyltransferase (adenine-specific)
MSIELFGILENIIVYKLDSCETPLYQIISGNRRKKAAEIVGLNEVPCTIVEPVEITEALVRSHQEHRTKEPSDILKELLVLKEQFGLRQGVRPTTPEMIKAKKYKDALISEVGKHTTDRLLAIHKVAVELSDNDDVKYKSLIGRLDKSNNITGTLKTLANELKEKQNRVQTPTNFEVRKTNIRIIPKSSENVEDIEDESVQLVVASPPFHEKRDYKLGVGELGHENTVQSFVNRLVNHFSDYKRILRKDGTMWINLGDYIDGFGYEMAPERFAIAMMDNGWILHDKIIWVKNNPPYSNSHRSVLANEFIYVFKKQDFVHYDTQWVKEHQQFNGQITYGHIDKKIKLKSVFDFRENIIITNVANNSVLANECKKQGYNLTHHATFPLSIPTIAILTGSKPGDLILDPFSGVATTAKATQILGRSFVGYELNPTYMKQGEIRLDMPLESEIEYLEESGTTAQDIDEVDGGRKYVGNGLNEKYLAISECRLENYDQDVKYEMGLAS